MVGAGLPGCCNSALPRESILTMLKKSYVWSKPRAHRLEQRARGPHVRRPRSPWQEKPPSGRGSRYVSIRYSEGIVLGYPKIA